LDVRFIELLPIDKHVAFMKGNVLTGQADNPFHEHDAWSCQSDRYYVAPLRLVEQVGQPIDEIDAVIAVGGKHAWTRNPYRQQDEFCNDETDGGQDHSALQRPPRVSSDYDPPQQRW
jgi:hypothetical protein